MGKIPKAMKIIPKSMKNLSKIADDVGDASRNAKKALQRVDTGAAKSARSATTASKASKVGMKGPVKVKVPAGASKAEVKQFENYVAGANRAIAKNALSKTGRVASTKNGVRRQASRAAAKERKSAADLAKSGGPPSPYTSGKIAGHVPDAAWMGKGDPFEWQAMSSKVNSSLAGQINRYPVGYKPTRFEIEY